jgi:hypothetical protein
MQPPPDAPVYEYSMRVVVHMRRRGEDTTERRHRLVKALTRQLGTAGDRSAPYVVDVCEVRASRRLSESEVTRAAGRRWPRRVPRSRHVRP